MDRYLPNWKDLRDQLKNTSIEQEDWSPSRTQGRKIEFLNRDWESTMLPILFWDTNYYLREKLLWVIIGIHRQNDKCVLTWWKIVAEHQSVRASFWRWKHSRPVFVFERSGHTLIFPSYDRKWCLEGLKGRGVSCWNVVAQPQQSSKGDTPHGREYTDWVFEARDDFRSIDRTFEEGRPEIDRSGYSGRIVRIPSRIRDTEDHR